MKKVKAIHDAVSSPIDDLVTFRALPTAKVPMEKFNPFIFLNHHGPQVYPPYNSGLPFGPHPHRGMETVTFIIEGDIMHKDSGGSESVINSGGIQWMSAGRGLIHAEVSSEEFKEQGGPLEILQLWLNLPAANKMMDPYYKGVQKSDLPLADLGSGASAAVISGNINNTEGVFSSVSGVTLVVINIIKGGNAAIVIPENKVVFFYIVRGRLIVNGSSARIFQLIEFELSGEEMNIQSEEESIVILGYADPLKEPIVAQGPFVMNTSEQIMEAYDDYQQGKFGVWKR
jgi:quercetin 2,3-dioxygenase